MPYLTPDDSGGTVYLCRRLRFRSELAHVITGALELLSNEWAWEAFGDMTPSEAADLAREALNYYLDAGDDCMVGSIWQGLTATVPEGVLELDGATYSVDDYPLLAAALDAVFINGDGTFTLPDARGRAGIGAGAGSGLTTRAVGDSVGVERVTLTFAELPAEATNVAFDFIEAEAGIGAFALYDINGYGGGQSHENMQPSIAWRVGVYWR